jgi:branched-chain amino acid transport system ATP-binding protein
MLELNNVEVAYFGKIPLLQGISLKVDDGQVVALLGGNGAGKSITLKAVSGLIHHELGHFTLSGTIEYNGQQIHKKLPEVIVKMGIVQVIEGHQVLDDLTVNENLLIGAHMCHGKKEVRKRLDGVYGYLPELLDLRRKRAGYLSGGEQQMLVIGRAMMAQPRVMLLDEISFGLAPLLIRRVFEIVKKINAESRTSILIAEQNARAALSVCHFVYMIANGKVVLQGPAERLKQDEKIKQFYLGLSKSNQGNTQE